MDSALDDHSTAVSRFAGQHPHLRECLVEYFGTFVMIVFGVGVNNEVNLNDQQNGTWLSIGRLGRQVLTRNNSCFWVPIVAPCLGSITGGYAHKLFVENHRPRVVQQLS